MAFKVNTITGKLNYYIPGSTDGYYYCEGMDEKRYSSDICYVQQSDTDGRLVYSPFSTGIYESGNISKNACSIDGVSASLNTLSRVYNEALNPYLNDYHDVIGNQWFVNGNIALSNRVNAGEGLLTLSNNSLHALILKKHNLISNNVSFSGGNGWTLEFFVRWVPSFWAWYADDTSNNQRCSVFSLWNNSTGQMFCISNPINLVAQGIVAKADVLSGAAKYPILYMLRNSANYGWNYDPNYTYVDGTNWHHVALINYPASMLTGLPDGTTDLAVFCFDGKMVANCINFGNDFTHMTIGGDPFATGGTGEFNVEGGANGLLLEEFRVFPQVLYDGVAGFTPPTDRIGYNVNTLYYCAWDFDMGA